MVYFFYIYGHSFLLLVFNEVMCYIALTVSMKAFKQGLRQYDKVIKVASSSVKYLEYRSINCFSGFKNKVIYFAFQFPTCVQLSY